MDLDAKERNGRPLSEEQQEKLRKRSEVEAELSQLKASEAAASMAPYSVASEVKVPYEGDVPTGLPLLAGAVDAAAADGTCSAANSSKGQEIAKSKKVLGLEKKLREIAGLEEKKRSGESLDKKQEEKIQKRAEIEAQIQAAMAEATEEAQPSQGAAGKDDALANVGHAQTPATEGLYMCHLTDAILGVDGQQRRRAKYFKTKNGLSWKQEFCGAFAVQKPEAKTQDNFDRIHSFEYFLWSTWPENFDCIKKKIAQAVLVSTSDFRLETMDGERIPKDADCIEKLEELSAKDRSCEMLEKKPLVRIKIVVNEIRK
ncbi:unnamed protein product [Symbiodinium natans]|uniref:Uncharacterized protein n=1 Tax=Symbiodinium natans TaxID=878477 RepID=A0A812U383_9DINO|nr:unnamed protein product [Symbiodinium natans]